MATQCIDEKLETSIAGAEQKATAAHLGVALLLLHAALAFVLHKSQTLIIWDASTPTSDAAFRLANTLRPLIWPIMGWASAIVALYVVGRTIISRALPRLLPADVAAVLLLMVPAILTWSMSYATPINPMIRIAANPFIYLPALPAYVLLIRNRLGHLSSSTWERLLVALIGLPSLLMLVRSAFGFVGWYMRI